MRARGVLLVLALLAAAGGALAHVPSFRDADRVVDEPGRSWAFYDTLPPGGEHAWTFTLDAGMPLFVHVGVPTGATWTPAARLEGPEGPIPLEPGEGVGLEPFTPYAAREVWTLDERAPLTGTYRLVISGEGGPYSFGYGLAEVFSPVEWATIPIAAVRIHLWEGQPWLAILAPYALALVGAAALALTRPRAPALLQVAGAGLLVGTGIERAAQTAIAAWNGAQAAGGAWGVALAIALLSLGLAVAAWRARRPATLVLIGAAALAAWSGLLVGPALLFAAAAARAMTPRRRGAGVRGAEP